MTVTLREFNKTDADFEALVRLDNKFWKHRVSTVEDWRHAFASAPRKSLWRQWMAEKDGCVVGTASQRKALNNACQGNFTVEVLVDPDARDCGAGKLLFDHCVKQLRKEHNEVSSLTCSAREDQPAAIRFLETEGFVPVMREELSQIEVSSFNPTPFQAKEDQCRRNGFEIHALSALKRRFPDWKKRVYSLENELEVDVPRANPFVPMPFDDYCRRKFEGPEFSAETVWIALEADEWLGMTELLLSKGDPSKAHTGMTGVRRQARRKGVATALKLRALAFAESSGVNTVQTDNEESNPMFQINLALGFKPIPALVQFRLDLTKQP